MMPSMCLPIIIPQHLLILPVTHNQFPQGGRGMKDTMFLQVWECRWPKERDSVSAPLKAEKLKHKFKSYQTSEKPHG